MRSKRARVRLPITHMSCVHVQCWGVSVVFFLRVWAVISELPYRWKTCCWLTPICSMSFFSISAEAVREHLCLCRSLTSEQYIMEWCSSLLFPTSWKSSSLVFWSLCSAHVVFWLFCFVLFCFVLFFVCMHLFPAACQVFLYLDSFLLSFDTVMLLLFVCLFVLFSCLHFHSAACKSLLCYPNFWFTILCPG